MPVSIKRLRTQLGITLSDLGILLGISRSRIHHFESGRDFERGEIREKLTELAGLVKRTHPGDRKNPWLNEDKLEAKAAEWKNGERQRARDYAEELDFRLKEMKADYADRLKSLSIMAQILDIPECPSDIRKWIRQVAPRVAKSTLKCGPEEQVRIQLRRNELLGRAK